MPMLPRIHYSNLVLGEGATLVPSSEQPGMTRDALLRQGSTDGLVFRVGWDVRDGENDVIPFLVSGVSGEMLANITEMNYATAELYASGVMQALETAYSPAAWTAAQSPTTGLWTISTAAHPFKLMYGSGTDFQRSNAGDIGFDKVDDSAYGLSKTGKRAAFQSRKWIHLDAGDSITPAIFEITETNDRLDFNRGGVKVAEVEHGTFTGQALAAAIQVAMEVADPGIGWAPFYPAFGSVFLIDNTTGTSWLPLTSSGVNVGVRSIFPTIGFSEDLEGGGPAQQWPGDIAVTGTPLFSADTGITIARGISDNARVRLEADATTTVLQGLDATVDFSTDLERDPDLLGKPLRLDEFPAVAARYWRLIIEDTASSEPPEVDVWFLGFANEITGVAPGISDERQELTLLIFAAEGAVSRVERETRRILHVRVHRIADVDKVTMEEFLTQVKVGGAFFFTLEPEDPWSVRYSFLIEGVTFEPMEDARPRLWSARMDLWEVIG